LNICGDGGLLTTNSKDLYQKVLALRNHGFKNRDRIVNFGYNSRLDTLQALVALYGLKKLNSIIKKRNKNANLYEKELKNIDGVVIPPRGKGKIQVFHTYIIQVSKREKLMKYLAEHGVQTKVHYPIPIHLQPPCKSMGYKKGDFPICEDQAKRILTLPIHQYLTKNQILYVTKLIKNFYMKH
jgi:dTDP-4-amino-4,6-dideoxygalactose transaminase